MTGAIAAMVTAIVGVLGTLAAPLLGQRMSKQRAAQDSAQADSRRPETVQAALKEADAKLSELTGVMRQDLGVLD